MSCFWCSLQAYFPPRKSPHKFTVGNQPNLWNLQFKDKAEIPLLLKAQEQLTATWKSQMKTKINWTFKYLLHLLRDTLSALKSCKAGWKQKATRTNTTRSEHKICKISICYLCEDAISYWPQYVHFKFWLKKV